MKFNQPVLASLLAILTPTCPANVDVSEFDTDDENVHFVDPKYVVMYNNCFVLAVLDWEGMTFLRYIPTQIDCSLETINVTDIDIDDLLIYKRMS